MRRSGFVVAGALLAVVACGGQSGVHATASVDTGAGAGTAPTATAAAAPVATAAPAPAPPVTVSFAATQPAAGMARVQRTWIGRNMLFAVEHEGAAAVTIEHVSGELDERREEILAVSNGVVTKVKVTFVHKESTVVENGRERKTPSVVAGKSYVVEAKDTGLFITTDLGRKVSQREGDVLAQEYEALGASDSISAALPSKPIAVGENAEGLVAAIRQSITRAAEGHVGFGDVSVSLRGTRDVGGAACGVFAVHLQLAYKLEKVENRADLTGELVVRTTDGQPVSLSLQGPVVMGGEAGHAAVEGQGDSRLEVTWASP